MEPVSVSVRVRPLFEKENENIVVRESSNPNVISIKNHTFSFDHVFIDDNQETVYSELMKPIVEKFLEGFNCSVLAYGHTGTGKTYTMGTDVQAHGTESAGLITRSMETIFERNSSTQDFRIDISFIEIYNEEVYDLLDEPVTKLEIKKGKRVCRTQVPVDTVEAVSELLKRGMSNRHTRPTVLNDSSSRSHAVLTIYRTATDGATSKLYLVDLAGLEGLRKTNNTGMAMREGINISQGLRVLGNILQKLSSNSKDFIPYRESVLTMILQDGLQSKNIISVIACVSPSIEHESDTLSTLRFVEETKNYKCKPEISHVVDQNKSENVSLKLPTTAGRVRKRKYLYKTPHSNRILPFSSRGTMSTCRSGNIRPLRRSLRRLPLMEMNSPDMSTISTMNVSTSTVMTISPVMKHYYEKYKADLNETIENVVRSQLKREAIVCCLPQKHARENGSDGSNETLTEAALTSLKEELKQEIRQLEEHSQSAFKKQLLTEMKNIVKEQVSEIINTQRKKIPDLGSPSVILVNRSVRYCTRLSMRRMSHDKENIAVTPEIEPQFISKITPALSTVKRVVSRGCSPLVSSPGGGCAQSTPRSVLRSSPNLFTSAVSTIQRRPDHDDMESNFVGSHSCVLNDTNIETPRYSSKQDTTCKRKVSTIQRRRNRRTPDQNNTELTYVGSHVLNDTDIETPRYSQRIRSKQDTTCKRKAVSTIQRKRNRCTPDQNNTELTYVGSHVLNDTDIETPRYSSKQDTTCTRKGKVVPVDDGEVTPVQKRMSTTTLRRTTRSLKPKEHSTSGKLHPMDGVEVTPVQTRRSTTTLQRTRRLHKPTEHGASDSPSRPEKASKKSKSSRPKGRNILQQEHNALVLSVLNSDNPREIERLPTIGPKTAMIIFNYRRLNGQFTSIEDLKKVVGLHKNYYNRFTAANSIVV